MGVEPERKFLVKDNSWMAAVEEKYPIAQAFLSKDAERIVRIRLMGDEAFLTVKGKAPAGTIETPEFEYEIPVNDAQDLMKLCLPGDITKTRHIVTFEGNKWEIDIFHGANSGLVMAEIEFKGEGRTFTPPPWLGEEVTQDRRYANSALSEKPYSTWEKPQAGKPKPGNSPAP